MKNVSNFWGEFLCEVVALSLNVDCEEYYRRVAGWVLIHGRDFGAGVLERTGLSVLIRLNPRLYLSSQPEIAPAMEMARLSAFVPDDVGDMAMVLRDTLLDMVTVWSPKDCPNCGGPMRTLVALLNGDRRIFLSCRDCAHEEWLDGSAVTTLVGRVMPARVNGSGKVV